MNRYALVKDGAVVNVIQWDGLTDWQPDLGVECILVGDVICGPGMLYENGEFIKAPPAP